MRCFLILLGLAAVQAAEVHSKTQENPIRRIVNLLQTMQKEVEAEVEKDEEMHEKFMCYCKTSQGTLQDEIKELEAQIPQIESSIKETLGNKAQLEADLATHKQDRADAKDAIDSATAQREKEAASFDADSTESKANIAACGKAVTAISKGMSSSFLQTGAATTLRNLVLNSNSLDRYGRGVLTAFLATSAGYAPASGEIVGILKQLLEDMEKELVEITDTENAAVAEFGSLTAAKKKTIQAATEGIESKTARLGETAVAVVNLKNDLEDAQDSLAENQKFATELKTSCGTAQGEYDERQKMRAEESVAVAATIKILNDDDALDLFKSTLPTTSFLQMQDVRGQALDALADVSDKKHGAQMQLIQMALAGKKAGFEKIVKMMGDMVELLKQEQVDDENQKEWCEKEFDTSEDRTKDLKRKVGNLETAIEETKAAISQTADEIKGLQDGIVALDKAVAEATAQRQAENEEYQKNVAMNNGALQLLSVAENRLNKFYNPKLYVAPQRRELTEEERIYVNSGGVDPRDEEEAQASQNTIAGTGVAVFVQIRSASNGAPPPPPATMAAYKKRDSSGPVQLIKNLANDLEKDMQASKHDEEDAQKDYQEMTADSAEKRSIDSTTITEKESQKAGLEGDLGTATKDHKVSTHELMELGAYMAELHGSCDFLIENFDMRRDARTGEIEAIGKATAVLSGADYSFVQTGAFLARHQ